MGDINREVVDVAKVEAAGQRFVAAAAGFQAAAVKFRTATQEFEAAVEESETATKELETATVELQVVSDWVEFVRNELRNAELVLEAVDFDPAAADNPVDGAIAVAITSLRAALGKVRPAEESLQDSIGKLDAAEVKLGAAKGERLDAARVKLVAAEDELRVAGDNVRAAAHADVPVSVDKSVFAYREIANLKEIYEPTDSLLKFALEDWQHKQKDLAIKVSRRENKSVDLTNQIFNIIGWYAVFQGVVLTAVSQLAQSNQAGQIPMCKKIWFPIVLTVFSTIVIVSGILYKFQGLEELEVTINTEKEARIELEKRVSNLRRAGPLKFRFSQHTNNSKEKATTPRAYWKNSIPVILSLVVFTGLFILSYLAILCNTWA